MFRNTGFAVAGYDVVSGFDLLQSKVGQPQQSPLPGSAAIGADYNGASLAHTTRANRDALIAEPDSYVPQDDGPCVCGVARSGKVPGNPALYRIVEGKRHVNITKNVVGFWETAIPGNLEQSTKTRSGLGPADASSVRNPGFRPKAPGSN